VRDKASIFLLVYAGNSSHLIKKKERVLEMEGQSEMKSR